MVGNHHRNLLTNISKPLTAYPSICQTFPLTFTPISSFHLLTLDMILTMSIRHKEPPNDPLNEPFDDDDDYDKHIDDNLQVHVHVLGIFPARSGNDENWSTVQHLYKVVLRSSAVSFEDNTINMSPLAVSTWLLAKPLLCHPSQWCQL